MVELYESAGCRGGNLCYRGGGICQWCWRAGGRKFDGVGGVVDGVEGGILVMWMSRWH